MAVKIIMITPWRFNVISNKILSAFSTLDGAKNWVWSHGYTYTVEMNRRTKR